jgi:hypothetical protein
MAGFLYGCKNSMERCKKVLDMHYTVRGAAPEFFKNRDPKSAEMQTCLSSVYEFYNLLLWISTANI